uniref:Calcineurin-like phosphoesterase domain-containing protein n=1 Tax=Globisporangium ultimum (strain ATCC 200006 / CBS 805.95 / DAOM BR144) TaxID=431595 RepID=K3WF95_GLOUD
MRVVCISDTHSRHDTFHAAHHIPDGDVLVHAGDFSDTGDRDEVVIAGNHDTTFDREHYIHNYKRYKHERQHDPEEVRSLLTNALYLEDQAVVIDGFTFYGSPWQPEYHNWAFNLPRGEKLQHKWRQIPGNTDVLVTHGPPLGWLDTVQVGDELMPQGCEALAVEVQTRIRPQYHVFGHIHEGYGYVSDGTTTYINASSCNVDYQAINPAIGFDLMASKSRHHEVSAPTYAELMKYQIELASQRMTD